MKDDKRYLTHDNFENSVDPARTLWIAILVLTIVNT